MSSFINSTDEGFAFQLNTFCSKIDTYSATLGLTIDEVKGVKADNDLFLWALQVQDDTQKFAQNFTDFKNLLRYGNGTEVLTLIPVPPVFPPPPPIVDANVQKRFSDLVKRIKGSPNYTKGIGENLGIEIAHTPFDPQLGKPAFKTSYSSGGHPNLIWKKGKFQGVEIWVNRNDNKGWLKLERDFHPDFIDKAALPPAGQSAVWNYKMIYLYKDEVVGEWSAEQSITVYGSV